SIEARTVVCTSVVDREGVVTSLFFLLPWPAGRMPLQQKLQYGQHLLQQHPQPRKQRRCGQHMQGRGCMSQHGMQQPQHP
ncbi:hypothetical protein PFISCL1PPCAC_28852, partial [Pristionchus fissidentatus]